MGWDAVQLILVILTSEGQCCVMSRLVCSVIVTCVRLGSRKENVSVPHWITIMDNAVQCRVLQGSTVIKIVTCYDRNDVAALTMLVRKEMKASATALP